MSRQESGVNVNTVIPYLCNSHTYHVYTALLILFWAAENVETFFHSFIPLKKKGLLKTQTQLFDYLHQMTKLRPETGDEEKPFSPSSGKLKVRLKSTSEQDDCAGIWKWSFSAKSRLKRQGHQKRTIPVIVMRVWCNDSKNREGLCVEFVHRNANTEKPRVVRILVPHRVHPTLSGGLKIAAWMKHS